MSSPYRVLLIVLFAALLLPSQILTAAEKRQDYDKLLRTYAFRKPGDNKGGDAWSILVNSSAPETTAAIRKGVVSRDARIRRASADLLGSRPSLGTDVLLIDLLDDRDARVRREAVIALLYQHIPAALEPLAARLKDRNDDVRIVATRALAWYGPRAVDALLMALTDHETQIRREAIWGLSGSRDPRVAPALVRLLADSDLSENAAAALGRCGEQAVPLLLDALPAAEGEVRSAILSALARTGDPRGYSALRAECANPDPRARADAVRRLSLSDPRAFDLIYAALRDPEAAVRNNAYRCLDWIVLDEHTSGRLLPLLDDPDRGIRYWGTGRLGEIHDPALVEPLLERLQRPEFSAYAITVLGQLGDPRAIAPLLRLVGEEPVKDTRDRFGRYYGEFYPDYAIDALAVIGVPAVESLITAIQSDNHRLREGAVKALGKITDARVRPALRDALNDPEKSIRLAAIGALAIHGDTGDDEVLAPLLDDDDADIRCAAAGALFGRQDPRLIAPLERMLDSNDARERYFATSVLGEMDDPAVAPLMLKAIGDKDGDVRTAVGYSTGAWIDATGMLEAYMSGRTLVSRRIERVDPEVAVPLLARQLQTKGDFWPEQAISMLRMYPGPEAARTLMEALTITSTRSEAAEILADWQISEAVPIAVREMTRLLRTDDPDRLDDFAELSALAGGQAFDLLAARLAQPVCHYERLSLIEALGATGDPRAVEPLLGELHNENFSIRESAILALSRLGDRRATPALIESLRDQNVRRCAIEALGRLRDPRAVEPLLAMLPDVYYTWQKSIIAALAAIGDRRAIEPLREMLRPLPCPETSRGVTTEVVKALVLLEDRDVANRLLPLLAAYLYDNSGGKELLIFHRTLIEALGNLREERALDLLITELQYGYGEAAQALGQIGGSHAAEALLAVLPMVDAGEATGVKGLELFGHGVESFMVPRLTWQVVVGRALGQIKDDGQQQRLTEALQSDNWRVRYGVAVALGFTGEPWAEPLLEQAQQDPQPQVCAAARQALDRLHGKAPPSVEDRETIFISINEDGTASVIGLAPQE